MSNSPVINQFSAIRPGYLGIRPGVRQGNCSHINVLRPSDTLTRPEDGASSIQDVQVYHYSQAPHPRDFVAADSKGPSGLTLPMTGECVRTVNPLSDHRWDELVARHPKASAFHQRGWLEAIARTYGYEPVVFTTASPNAELENGLLFCHIESWLTGHRLVSLPFSDHCEPICDSAEEMNSLICAAQAALENQRWQYLEVRPTSADFGQVSAGVGFRRAGRYFLHVMDLRPDLEDLFRSFDKDSVQRRITRAERAGLVEKSGTSGELLKAFYHLFVTTRVRHHLPPPPYAWFQNLVQCQRESLEIRVAYKDENPIAAILTLRFRETGYFKYGCSDARFNRFGATPWLLWRAISAAKSSGALEFDMGRTQEDNAGLLAFKNHWVARNKRLTYWRYSDGPSVDRADDWKLKVAKRVFSLMPRRLLVEAGKVMYRHIG
jgi:GNAT acetyltransferase-like protein